MLNGRLGIVHQHVNVSNLDVDDISSEVGRVLLQTIAQGRLARKTLSAKHCLQLDGCLVMTVFDVHFHQAKNGVDAVGAGGHGLPESSCRTVHAVRKRKAHQTHQLQVNQDESAMMAEWVEAYRQRSGILRHGLDGGSSTLHRLGSAASTEVNRRKLTFSASCCLWLLSWHLVKPAVALVTQLECSGGSAPAYLGRLGRFPEW